MSIRLLLNSPLPETNGDIHPDPTSFSPPANTSPHPSPFGWHAPDAPAVQIEGLRGQYRSIPISREEDMVRHLHLAAPVVQALAQPPSFHFRAAEQHCHRAGAQFMTSRRHIRASAPAYTKDEKAFLRHLRRDRK